MSKKVHYREADTRLYLSGLKLEKPVNPDKIAMSIATNDGKFRMTLKYSDLLSTLLLTANKNLEGGVNNASKSNRKTRV